MSAATQQSAFGTFAVEALQEVLAEVSSEQERVVFEQLQPGETLIGFHMGQTRMPFLLRLMPFVPDLMTRPKHFALVVTNGRLLIVRVKAAMVGNTYTGKPVVATPLAMVAVTAGQKSVVIQVGGKVYKYKGMADGAAASLRRLVEHAQSRLS